MADPVEGTDVAQGTCSIDNCGSPLLARDWCQMHYMRWYRHGDPNACPQVTIRQGDGQITCSACGRALAEKCFYRDKTKPNGRSSRCRECVRAASARRYEADPQAALAAMKRHYEANRAVYIARAMEWGRAHPEYGREQARRYAAKKRGATIGTVTPALIVAKFAYWGNKCWMCGGPGVEPDHVKPLAKGGPHMLANLRPSCVPCNRSKQDRWPYPLTLVPAPQRACG